jgi:hypothetical protein
MNYYTLIDQELPGSTPKAQYEWLKTVQEDAITYKAKTIHACRNIKAIMETPTLDENFKMLLNILYDVMLSNLREGEKESILKQLES